MSSQLDNSKIVANTTFVKTGQDVEFECLSNGSTTWSFSGGPLPNNVGVITNTLYITEASKLNAGVYECEGKSNETFLRTGEQATFYSHVKLSIEGNNVINSVLLDVYYKKYVRL